MSKESYALGLGKVFFSYAPESGRVSTGEKSKPRPQRFVRDTTDIARLLPRLRG